MRLPINPNLLIISFIAVGGFWCSGPQEKTYKLEPAPKKKYSKETKSDFAKARWKYEYDMLKDPGTGRIPRDIREKEFALARQVLLRGDLRPSGTQGAETNNNYIAVGPDSIGGRTRAVAFDKRYNGTTNRVILAGSVSGGIMRSADGGETWTRVSPEDDIHNLSALAQDPRAGSENIWYAGGGEPVGNSTSEDGAPYLSSGIWKSTNNGLTWTKMAMEFTDIDGSVRGGGTLESFDHPFDFVHEIAVNPVNGNVYVAGHRRLLRSANGGTSWNVVFSGTSPTGSAAGQMDVAITNAGLVYLAVNGGIRDRNIRGVWNSSTGNLNSWTRIAGGNTLNVDSVAGWRGNSYSIDAIDPRPSPPDTTFFSKRIIFALAPSNQNIIYITYENGLTQDGTNPKPEADLFKLDRSSGSLVWTNLSANVPDFPGQLDGVDPLELQEGYNLMITVKPDNPNVVFLGGTNLFRSTNGFSTSTATAWIGGYGEDFASGLKLYPRSHPDMHNLQFIPDNNGSNPGYLKAIAADDGGLQFTDNIMATATTYPVTWRMVRNYQTLQYFHVGIDPKSGNNNFIGGAQDNGTQIRYEGDGSNHTRVLSGDGGAAAIADLSTQALAYASVQLGPIYRFKPSRTEITPTGLTPFPGFSEGFGDFVTYFKMDNDNPEDLYYVNFNRLFRTGNASTVTSSAWTELEGVAAAVNPNNPDNGTDVSIRAIELSRGPYFPSHALYIGTSNGKVFRLNNPRSAPASTEPEDITPPDLETFRLQGAPVNINDIAVNPNNDEEIMVVVSNYSVTVGGTARNDINIWWTNNAKSSSPTWRKAEGNLTLPSVRSCMIVPKKEGSTSVTEYYVGTSVGLYSAVDIGPKLQSNTAINWAREGGGVLNFAVITSMDYRPEDNVLLIGTHGNGLYYAEIGSPDFRPNQNTPTTDPDNPDKKFIETIYPTVIDNRINYQVGNMFTINRIRITVTSMSGQVVYRRDAAYTNGVIDLPSISKGAYVLSITSTDNSQKYTRKFVKR